MNTTQQANTVRAAIQLLTDTTEQLHELRDVARHCAEQAKHVPDFGYALVPTHLLDQLRDTAGGAPCR